MRTNGKKIAIGVLGLAVVVAVAVPLLMQRGETAPISMAPPSSGQASPTLEGSGAEKLSLSPVAAAALPPATTSNAQAPATTGGEPSREPPAETETGQRQNLPTETAARAPAAEGVGADDSASAVSSPIVSSEETPLQSSRAVKVDAREFRQLLPRDAIVPIYAPKFVSAGDADLALDELVIGVEIDGESKAYPIGPLVQREMVNDVIAGVPILVTW